MAYAMHIVYSMKTLTVNHKTKCISVTGKVINTKLVKMLESTGYSVKCIIK